VILIVYPKLYGVDGIARYLRSFCEAVGDKKSVVVIAGGPNAGEHIIAGVRVIVLPMAANRLGLVQWSFRLRKFLPSFCKQNHVSAVNFHIPPLIPGLLLPKVPRLVVTVHTTYLGMSGQFYKDRQFKSQWNGASVWIKKAFERIIFHKSDAVIVLTDQGRQEVKKYRYGKKIIIVPNGASTSSFAPDYETEKTYDVLFAGRIERRKGSRPMVDVCKLLVELKPDIRICIVGYGDDFEYVSASLGPLAKNVVLTGKILFEDIIEIYRRSRIYASTSYYEGLPGTCLEAMAVGLPAVVWNYPFYHELVVSGVNGYLVDINDIKRFAAVLVSTLADSALMDALGRAANKKIKDEYDWPVIAKRLVDELDSVSREFSP